MIFFYMNILLKSVGSFCVLNQINMEGMVVFCVFFYVYFISIFSMNHIVTRRDVKEPCR